MVVRLMVRPTVGSGVVPMSVAVGLLMPGRATVAAAGRVVAQVGVGVEGITQALVRHRLYLAVV
jgi:hypothetical protein